MSTPTSPIASNDIRATGPHSSQTATGDIGRRGRLTRASEAIVCQCGKIVGRAADMEKPIRRRGFLCGRARQEERFDQIVRSFATGYRLALEYTQMDALVTHLLTVDLAYRGFAFEGAGMGLGLRECLVPGRHGLVMQLANAEAGQFTYLVHVGAGWVLGWAPRATRVADHLDPLLKGLAYDGLGFREAFFKWSSYSRGAPAPRWITGERRNAFDQGLGRCLWFTAGGNAQRVMEGIAVFAEERRADLWAGAGLAVTYAGQLDQPSLWRRHCGEHHAALAQGVCFAAKAIARGGQLDAYHEKLCRELIDLSALDAAAVTDRCLAGLEFLPSAARYPAWQAAIRGCFK